MTPDELIVDALQQAGADRETLHDGWLLVKLFWHDPY